MTRADQLIRAVLDEAFAHSTSTPKRLDMILTSGVLKGQFSHHHWAKPSASRGSKKIVSFSDNPYYSHHDNGPALLFHRHAVGDQVYTPIKIAAPTINRLSDAPHSDLAITHTHRFDPAIYQHREQEVRMQGDFKFNKSDVRGVLHRLNMYAFGSEVDRGRVPHPYDSVPDLDDDSAKADAWDQAHSVWSDKQLKMVGASHKVAKKHGVPFSVSVPDEYHAAQVRRAYPYLAGRITIAEDNVPDIRLPGRVNENTIAKGECFSWAFKRLLDHHVKGEHDAVLVHASVKHPWTGKRYEHAWVEHKGKVYDWQSTAMGLGKQHTVASFKAGYEPKQIKRYNGKQAVRASARAKHYGPW